MSEAEISTCKQEADYAPACVLLARVERNRKKKKKRERKDKEAVKDSLTIEFEEKWINRTK